MKTSPPKSAKEVGLKVSANISEWFEQRREIRRSDECAMPDTWEASTSIQKLIFAQAFEILGREDLGALRLGHRVGHRPGEADHARG